MDVGHAFTNKHVTMVTPVQMERLGTVRTLAEGPAHFTASNLETKSSKTFNLDFIVPWGKLVSQPNTCCRSLREPQLLSQCGAPSSTGLSGASLNGVYHWIARHSVLLCVCITSAALSIFLQDVPAGAGAQVASVRVLTDEVARLWCLYALIHIWWERARQRERVSSERENP